MAQIFEPSNPFKKSRKIAVRRRRRANLRGGLARLS
jgi:hypothetical protein